MFRKAGVLLNTKLNMAEDFITKVYGNTGWGLVLPHIRCNLFASFDQDFVTQQFISVRSTVKADGERRLEWYIPQFSRTFEIKMILYCF